MNSLYLSSALTCLTLLLFCSCSSVKRVSQTRQNISLPEPNKVVSNELGETLIDKGFITTCPAFTIDDDVDAKHYGGMQIKLGAGTYAAWWEDAKNVYYAPADANQIVLNHSSQVKDWEALGFSAGYAIRKEDNSLSPFIRVNLSFELVKFEDGKAPSFKKGHYQEIGKPTFRQQLIYNGKIDNDLKFLYREFSNNFARAPFSQEVQYDLNESPIIGFKGARLEVVEATNRKIKYKVLANFPDN